MTGKNWCEAYRIPGSRCRATAAPRLYRSFMRLTVRASNLAHKVLT
jgi:hypothetical protein